MIRPGITNHTYGYDPKGNRPSREPGGCECMTCERIFIGAEHHTECAICIATKEATGNNP